MNYYILAHNYDTCRTCQAMRDELARLHQEIARLEWDETVNMFNAAGGYRAIDALPDGEYALVFCDIDYLKSINSATKNHIQTNVYLAGGLAVRVGEIAIRLMGDEFLFILGNTRGYADPMAFVGRLTDQLAAQPLTEEERAGLPNGVLSATFAWRKGVAKSGIRDAIGDLSRGVLTKKDQRGVAA